MNSISKYCNGCKACYFACPVDAIKIKIVNNFPKAEIDKKKCINCGLCKKVCAFNYSYETNHIINKFIVRLKDSKKIMQSSSGGFFGELARNLLDQKYIIYGAGFTIDWNVEHIRITNKKDLRKILKSKYVQSNLALSFKNVLKDLKEGQKVLFSGTPCQVSSLKKFLLKDYENLYTVDLICHGTPSPVIWKKYLNSLKLKTNANIVGIDFRYFNSKDPLKNLLIQFDNKKKLNEHLYDNVFGKAFGHNIILNKSCTNCLYTNTKNQSDLTMGDAHGYKTDEFNNKFSTIIINSKKGQNLFDNIREKFFIYKDYDVKDLIFNNYPLIHSSLKHYNSDLILKDSKTEVVSLLTNAFENLIPYSKKNVAILNYFYENYNYGANLVAYSMFEIFKKLGYNPYIINFNPFEPLEPLTQFKTLEFVKFREQYIKLTPLCKNFDDLLQLNLQFDNFIVGSDQIWRKEIAGKNLLRYFLDFVIPSNKRIAYGASFGNTSVTFNKDEQFDSIKLLNNFSGVSVRELDAMDILEKKFECKSSLVLDPTLMLTTKEYEQLIDGKWNHKNYIAYYCLFDQEKSFLDEMKRLFPINETKNIKLVDSYVPFLDETISIYRSISDWISGIKNSKFVITDSYHGMLFAILYKKEFICLGKNSQAKSRFDSICSILGGNLEKRVIGSLSDIKNVKNLHEINYEIINKNLERYRKQSWNFINKSLKVTNKKINKQDYINLYHNISHLEQINSQLITENKSLSEENKAILEDCRHLNNVISNLYKSRSWRITRPLRVSSSRIKEILKKTKKT